MKQSYSARVAVALCCLIGVVASGCLAQVTEGNAAAPEADPMALRDVTITSSADGSEQHAMFWTPTQVEEPVPLLVDLHTWSGDYKQSDPRSSIFEAAQARGWAFIHPDFRGPNVRPEACASDLAVADVLDAVEYAKRQGLIDEDRVYLIGVSGGGHMALVMASRSPHTWAGVSAWVPISDLAAWHAQNCKDGQPGKYALHLEQVCGGAPGASDAVDAEYHKRSSLWRLPEAAGLPIDINTGINDGHTGSVPISQSLRAFNALAVANGHSDRVIDDATLRRMEQDRQVPPDQAGPLPVPGERRFPVLFRREAGPVRVTVFDGGHQHDTVPAIEWLALQHRGDQR